ncbi:lipid II flippase MurJ [Bifidobacterium aquikefiricola]|uniref:Murein biosynthesis integral membrane protein MurJ n=2 Tax=Bifidobacterium TaxID=1678 RepID=A0AB39U7D5_9BIFI
MASGTAASRVTGQIRTILLAAALGTTGTAINAYQTGAMIPQVMFTLISGGIFNAVLVPQIVRTLKSEHAEERLNKLITTAIVLLLGLTLLLMLGTSVLTSIYLDSRWDGPQRALVDSFTLWCMPQIFFYGLYTVLGQLLAAKGRFTAYAWSSVGANIISCAGFIVFIVIFGNAQHQDLAFWTPMKTALTAGTWTIGVGFQALVLFWPLFRSGFKFTFRWGIRGIGLRSMGPIAAWSLGVVAVNQLANVIDARITNGAPLAGHDPFGIAGNGSYQNAYALYILPYSLIAVSVTTAMFPKLSKAIADHRINDARIDLSQALRNVGLLMMYFTVALIAMPVPITRALLPSVDVREAILIAQPLVGLSWGLVAVSAFLLIQRTFYAFEDGRNPFIFALLFNALQVIIVLIATTLVPPSEWTSWVGISLSLGVVIAFPFLAIMLRKRFGGHMDGRRISLTYAKSIVAGAVALIVCRLLYTPVLHLAGSDVTRIDGHMSWVQSIIICIILVAILTLVYGGLLVMLRTEEFTSMLVGVKGRVSSMLGSRSSSTTIVSPDDDAAEVSNTIPAPDVMPASIPVSMARAQKTRETSTIPLENSRPSGIRNVRMSGVPVDSTSVGHLERTGSMKPTVGDTFIHRYTLVASLRDEPGLQAWKATDRVLARDCQLFIVTDETLVSQTNTFASGLALRHNRHFTPVYHFSTQQGVGLLVTALDAGISVSDYLAGPEMSTLSFEAMRTIVGEACDALISLKQAHLIDAAVSADTIRLSESGISLAAAPINMMLEHPLARVSTRESFEELATRQLSGVLYAMLTRTPEIRGMKFTEDSLPSTMPDEFGIICRRGLHITGSHGREPIPLITLAELSALLGTWSPTAELSDEDIVWPKATGRQSIEQVGIVPSPDLQVLQIPDSFAPQDETNEDSAEPKWATNQLLFPESSEVQLVRPKSSDGDFFSAFDDGTHTHPRASRRTSPYDVSQIRGDSLYNTGDIPADTGSLDLGDLGDGYESADRQRQAERVLDEQMTATMQPLPPSFTPKPRDFTPRAKPDSQFRTEREESTNDDSSSGKIMGFFTTRSMAIIVGIIVILVALFFAVTALFGDVGKIGGSSSDTNTWPDMSNVTLPGVSSPTASTGGSGASSASPSASASSSAKASSKASSSASTSSSGSASPTAAAVTHADKDAAKVPDPAVQNTTAYAAGTETYVNQPGGLQGRGWYIHLTQAERVSRLVISIRQSGGQGQIYVNSTPTSPNQGSPVAQFTFDASGTTEVKLATPVSTQDVMVWVPLTSTPSGGLFFNSVKVY